ncbi:MAG: hypothetical protein AAGL89_10990 [Pseudomonadota bacterium]
MKLSLLVPFAASLLLIATSASAVIDESAGSPEEALVERVFDTDLSEACALPMVRPAQVATAPDGSLVMDRVVALVGVSQSTVFSEQTSAAVATC